MTYPYGFNTGRYISEDGQVVNIADKFFRTFAKDFDGISIIDLESLELIRGNVYFRFLEFDIDGEGTYEKVFTTNDEDVLVTSISVSTDIDNIIYTLVEDPEITNIGSEVENKPINANRRSEKESKLTFYEDSDTQNGLMIDKLRLEGVAETGAPGPTQAQGEKGTNFINSRLALNTNYTNRVQKTDSGSGTVTVLMRWIELEV